MCVSVTHPDLPYPTNTQGFSSLPYSLNPGLNPALQPKPRPKPCPTA